MICAYHAWFILVRGSMHEISPCTPPLYHTGC